MRFSSSQCKIEEFAANFNISVVCKREALEGATIVEEDIDILLLLSLEIFELVKR